MAVSLQECWVSTRWATYQGSVISRAVASAGSQGPMVLGPGDTTHSILMAFVLAGTSPILHGRGFVGVDGVESNGILTRRTMES